MMAEGIVVVPLYARQAPAELVAMMKDSTPARIFCLDAAHRAEIQKIWPQAPPISLAGGCLRRRTKRAAARPFATKIPTSSTIIYTSGTSGEPKGVILNAGKRNHMLGCTNTRLDQLMGSRTEARPHFSLRAILLCRLVDPFAHLALAQQRSHTLHGPHQARRRIKLAAPNYFLNVPTLLERVRAKIQNTIQQARRLGHRVFTRAQRAYIQPPQGTTQFGDSFWLSARRIR